MARMIPDLASVMRKRYRMERNIRFAALVLFVIWIVYFAFGLATVWPYFFERASKVRIIMSLTAPVPFLLGAVFLGGLSRRIARWVLPLPRSGCPRCGYRLVALIEPRCPECGLALPAELMGEVEVNR